MAERRDLGEEGRQQSLFDALDPPSAAASSWAEPASRDGAAERDEIARLEAFAPAPEEVTPPEASAGLAFAVPPAETDAGALVDVARVREGAPSPSKTEADPLVDEPLAAPAHEDAPPLEDAVREDVPEADADMLVDEPFAATPEAMPSSDLDPDALVDDPYAPAPDLAPPEGDDKAFVDEPFATPAIEEVGERREPRTAGKPLAGPTLDDVLSRVWEGLATGLPAACPVCHGELEPLQGTPLTGRCRSCGTTID